MGVQKHTMIIYITIYFEVTNTTTLPLNQEVILLTQFINTGILLCIIWIIIQFSSSSSRFGSSLDLDHHHQIQIITRSVSSSLDLDHHLIQIIIIGSSSQVLSHDSSRHKKFYSSNPFSCWLQAQPPCRSSPALISNPKSYGPPNTYN